VKNALIIHGAYGNNQDNWIPWLKQNLEQQRYSVTTPNFPTPENQNLTTWMNVIDELQYNFNSETIVIGHSIACAFMLSLLEKYTVKQAIFVAGFIEDLTTPELDNTQFDVINNTFYNKPFNWEAINNNAEVFTIIHSDNDPYVPLWHAEKIASYLNVEPIVIPGGGHFGSREQCVNFAALLDQVK
jgi:predicted alpha/beta hydrolase family esterase